MTIVVGRHMLSLLRQKRHPTHLLEGLHRKELHVYPARVIVIRSIVQIVHTLLQKEQNGLVNDVWIAQRTTGCPPPNPFGPMLSTRPQESLQHILFAPSIEGQLLPSRKSHQRKITRICRRRQDNFVRLSHPPQPL